MTVMIQNSDLQNAVNAFPHGLKFAVVSGASASAAITLTGAAVGDKLMMVVEVAVTTGAHADRTATTSITAANEIKCTDDTSNDQLFIMWFSKG